MKHISRMSLTSSSSFFFFFFFCYSLWFRGFREFFQCFLEFEVNDSWTLATVKIKLPSGCDSCGTCNPIYLVSGRFCTSILRRVVCVFLYGYLWTWEMLPSKLEQGKKVFFGMLLPGWQGKIGYNRSIFLCLTELRMFTSSLYGGNLGAFSVLCPHKHCDCCVWSEPAVPCSRADLS